MKKKEEKSDTFLNLLWGGSNEDLKSMFLIKNKKNNVYPDKTPVLL